MKTMVISLLLFCALGCRADESLPNPGKDFPPEVRTLLEGAEVVEIFAIHPYPHEAEGKPAPGEDFQGYKILGRKKLESVEDRLRIVALIYEACAKPGPFAACFNPRHAVRAKRGEEIVELVICFECDTLRIERPGKPRVTLPIATEVSRSMNAFYGRKGLSVHGK